MASGRFVQARGEGLIVERADEDVVVYDVASKQAHVLAGTAALMWDDLVRGTTVAALAAATGADGGEAAIELALVDLAEAGLLDPAAVPALGLSRRTLLKRMGIAAVTVPFVTTILTASPAAAVVGAACGPSLPACGSGQVCVNSVCYQTCTANSQCATSNCKCDAISGSGTTQVCHINQATTAC